MHGTIFVNDNKIHKMTTTTNDQLAGGTDLPASSSFIDVSPYERFHILGRNGVVHASDEPTLEPKVADAVGGTLDQIDSSLIHTVDPGDDQELFGWTIEVRKLAVDHHFIALDVAGTVSNGSFADIILIGEVESKPATQITSVLPAASWYTYVG